MLWKHSDLFRDVRNIGLSSLQHHLANGLVVGGPQGLQHVVHPCHLSRKPYSQGQVLSAALCADLRPNSLPVYCDF